MYVGLPNMYAVGNFKLHACTCMLYMYTSRLTPWLLWKGGGGGGGGGKEPTYFKQKSRA